MWCQNLAIDTVGIRLDLSIGQDHIGHVGWIIGKVVTLCLAKCRRSKHTRDGVKGLEIPQRHKCSGKLVQQYSRMLDLESGEDVKSQK